ncbi:oligosaccharide flippase family protein [Falsiroseomonas sp.]|uniref:oligosaccharide flippase family protein n=1 Tax=Falsiroseomonas sp. TaxID=2870721 RepID=UPI003568B4AC
MSAEAQRGSILSRTAMGAGWMFAWRMTTRFLGLFSTLVLVRLLTPADFGLFSLAFAVIATLETVLATGVEAQLIRARQTSRALYDTVFTMNVIRGVLLALLMVAFAAPAAAFFREPRLESVVQVLALIPLLGGVANVGVAEFSRELEFGKVFKLLIVPRLLQIVVTLVAAVVLQSHWALVYGAVFGRVLATLFSYVFHPFRPRLSLALWRELIRLSFWTWAISIAMAVRDRTPTFVVGRMLGLRELGLLTVSHEIATLPTSEIAGPISQAAMPGLAASLRSPDGIQVSEAFLRMLGLTLTVCLPACFGLSLVAAPTVALVLGPQWLETAPIIAVLAAGYAAVAVTMLGMALLDARARLGEVFAFVTLGAVLRLAALASLLFGSGLLGFVAGIASGLLVEAVALTAWCVRRERISARRLLHAAWRPVVATAAMVVILWASGLGWIAPAPAGPIAAASAAIHAVTAGALMFTVTLGCLWWLSGTPPGAERDLLSAIKVAQTPILRTLRIGNTKSAQ